MIEYLGEEIVDIKNSPFKDCNDGDWAMMFIERYGQIDGSHHKQWVIDQVARILLGTKVILKEAKWSDGLTEYRIETDEPSYVYTDWVEEQKGKTPNGEYEYNYDEGIAP
jgi:hypothetical protein